LLLFPKAYECIVAAAGLLTNAFIQNSLPIKIYSGLRFLNDFICIEDTESNYSSGYCTGLTPVSLFTLVDHTNQRTVCSGKGNIKVH